MLSPSRLAASLVTTATLVAGAFLAPPAHAESAVSYAALGDSYSSGLGAGAYLPDSGTCNRSANAHPALWSRAHRPAAFAFVACSGATTADVRAHQVAAVTPTTSLVTITAGGNDAGFAATVVTCVLGTDRVCADAAAQAETYARDVLPADLDATYAAIRDRGPNARLVVLGYPRLFELGNCLLGLSEAKRRVLNRAADTLAETTARRADAAGAEFVDVRDDFAGHGVCAAQPWIHGVTLPVNESYHPTRTGQAQGYLPALDDTTDRIPAL